MLQWSRNKFVQNWCVNSLCDKCEIILNNKVMKTFISSCLCKSCEINVIGIFRTYSSVNLCIFFKAVRQTEWVGCFFTTTNRVSAYQNQFFKYFTNCFLTRFLKAFYVFFFKNIFYVTRDLVWELERTEKGHAIDLEFYLEA